MTVIDPNSPEGQRMIRNAAFEKPTTQGDAPQEDIYQRAFRLEQEVARLRRYIATWPARPYLETDHPDVVACMGSAPECAANGCRLTAARNGAFTFTPPAVPDRDGW